ncbi:MAG: thioredoxin domain-containing protein [Pseudomonadota bacterium]
MNRLASETSPYLQQHAHNPVDWYPWGEEALARARTEDKPILLSIGYSACHWCHVMAHESFEDEATARVMNELFINIKVDREERPDLDKIYQTAHQLLMQRGGGWPLTVFLSPEDQTPFFAGTYFPRERRYGMPPFAELMRNVVDFFHEHRAEIRQQNASLVHALHELDGVQSNRGERLTAAPLDIAHQQLKKQFDEKHGGFGPAPKFPHANYVERLLRHEALAAAQGQSDANTLAMVTTTLDAMAYGGLYDHLGGGFYRYAVDGEWQIPHFEKMLYDNGPLLALYAQAFQRTGAAHYRAVVEQTAAWVLREMQSAQGGYYSSLDADSEGEEGRFYVWDKSAVKNLLSEDEWRVAQQRFGFDQPANFEGHWHVQVPPREREMLDAHSQALLEQARAKLFSAREQRVRPGRDEKILTSWNALMIKGMACAGRILQRPEWIASAERALDFIRADLLIDGRLKVSYKDGQATLNAYLDDYVFLADAILELLQARWRDGDLAWAVQLMEVVLTQFEDTEHGGFYFTSHDHERLIHRSKVMGDDALPSGNGVAAKVFARLGHLLAEPHYLQAAERTLQAAWPVLAQVPYIHSTLLDALQDVLYPVEVVVLRGRDAELMTWQRSAQQRYAPQRLCLAIPEAASDLPAGLAQYAPGSGVTAYVCRAQTCEAPLHDHAAFVARMS